MKHMLRSKEIVILLILLVLSTIIALNNSNFLRVDNIFDLLKGNAVLGIMAFGMLLVIITGGIDVSVGATVAAVTVIVGKFAVNYGDGGNMFLVFLVGCLSGIAFGVINGVLISKLKLPPIVVTLGTMSIINGLNIYYTKGRWISDIPQYYLDFGRKMLFSVPNGQGEMIGIPIQIIFFIGAALVTWFILKFTVIGRGIYAMGGNPISASRIGYNLENIKIFVYSFVGFMTGLAGVIHTSIMQQVDPNAFVGFELQVIGAVVLGGANIVGGAGSVFGTILGVLLFAIINNGLILMRIPLFWQQIIVGLIIIIAVSVDVLQKKYAERKLIKVDI